MMYIVFVLENDTCGTKEWMKRKFASHMAIWRELIVSLRDDEQVKSQEPRSANSCGLMTRANGRS